MLQKPRGLRNAIRAATLAVGLSGAALAEPTVHVPIIVPFTAPAAMVPSNSVRCVYDLMTLEDREMALLLFEREVATGVKFHGNSRYLKVIDRLVGEARAKCSAPYDWSSGRSAAAIGYAMNELMRAGVTQALDAKGRTTDPIDAYYTKHRAELAGIETIEGAKADEFRAYLFEQGWAKSETAVLGMAEVYLAALLTRERQAKSFAAAAARPAAASKASANRRAARARTTRRGTP